MNHGMPKYISTKLRRDLELWIPVVAKLIYSYVFIVDFLSEQNSGIDIFEPFYGCFRWLLILCSGLVE